MCRRNQQAEIIRLLQEINQRLDRIEKKETAIMAAIDNLNTADSDLKNEVVTIIQDWATTLANAEAANDPAVQSVATDIENVVAQLKGSDPTNPAPVTPPAPPAPPASS